MLSSHSAHYTQAFTKILGQNVLPEELVLIPMMGGMVCAHLLEIRTGGQRFVVRPFGTHYTPEQRQSEVAVHMYAAKQGIAPEILYVDPELAYMILPYIEHRQLSREDVNNPEMLKRLGEIIYQIHHFNVGADRQKPLHKRTLKHLLRSQEKDITLPTGFETLVKECIGRGEALFAKGAVMTHRDLNKGNILIDHQEKIHLIDWSSSSLDSPFTEISFLSFTNYFSAGQLKQFMESYHKTPFILGSEEHQKIQQAQRDMCLHMATTWFSFSGDEADQNRPYQERQAELDQWLEDPGLKTGIQHMRDETLAHIIQDSKRTIRKCALGFYKSYLNWERSSEAAHFYA